MGVSTGQIFQPKLMQSVEPQKRESTWEQVLPTILTSLAQTAVGSYIKNQFQTQQQEQEMLAKGYTKNPDGSWNPPAGWISESAIPGVLQTDKGFMADPRLKSESMTSLDALETAIARQRIANGEDPDKVAAEYRQRRKEQPLNVQTGLQIPGTDQTGPMQMVRQPDGSVVAKPIRVDMGAASGQSSSQGPFPMGAGLAPRPQSGAAPTQAKQTISANAFSPTTRATPTAAPSAETPIAPTQPLPPTTGVPTTPSTTAQVVGQVAPQYAVSAPKKTDIAKPSFEQDNAIKAYAERNNLDPNALTAGQKHDALMEATGQKVSAQEEAKRAGINVDALAYSMYEGDLSQKSLVGAAGSRTAIRGLVQGKVKEIAASEDLKEQGIDRPPTKDEINKARFDFTKLDANYNWETNPNNLRTQSMLKGALPRLNILEKQIGQLGNTDITKYNDVKKWFETELGKESYTNYQSNLAAIVQEINTAMSGSATGSDLRVQLELENLKSSRSPAQLIGATNNLRNAMLARLDSSMSVPWPMEVIRGKISEKDYTKALYDTYGGDYNEHPHLDASTMLKGSSATQSPSKATAAPSVSSKPMDLPTFYTEYAKQFPDKFNTEEGKNKVWADWLKYRKAMGLQ